jgi:hypothetical protein
MVHGSWFMVHGSWFMAGRSCIVSMIFFGSGQTRRRPRPRMPFIQFVGFFQRAVNVYLFEQFADFDRGFVLTHFPSSITFGTPNNCPKTVKSISSFLTLLKMSVYMLNKKEHRFTHIMSNCSVWFWPGARNCVLG